MKGPSWKVETGRRDGRVSNITEALTNLIPPTANITQLKSGFQQRGLSVKDLVVLSGMFECQIYKDFDDIWKLTRLIHSSCSTT